MSIELLPPSPKYPATYHVRRNSCRCHPETCCCDDWAVHDADGDKIVTFFHKESAERYAADMQRFERETEDELDGSDFY